MKQHQHIYDEHGAQVCCTLEEKINRDAKQKITTEDNDEGCCNHHSANNVKQSSGHNDGHDHDHDHDHQHGSGIWSMFRTAIISLALLLVGLGLDHVLHPQWFSGYIRIILYIAAYLPVGLPVLRDAWVSITKGQFFSEFFLMSLATIGAFAIGEYPESVAVMLFYTIGEGFQMLAVKRAKLNIQTLLDQRPDEVSILRSGEVINIKAENAAIGDIIQLKPGEKLALDGVLISTAASFNTAALTGESVPQTKKEGDVALAGMVNLNSPIQVRVTTAYQDSKLSRILQMVQDASSRKAPTELFIRKFAKIYTPIVVVLAAMICLLPILFVEVYSFQEWLYRALVFLVISCPCALVISIPLGYFGGIGAASKNGILIKGGNFLDVLAGVTHVVMDKTGTLTEGVFNVQELKLEAGFEKSEVISMLSALQSMSTHPISTAIQNYAGKSETRLVVSDVEEISAHGLKGQVDGKEILVGNFRLLDKYSIIYPDSINSLSGTVTAFSIGGRYAGYMSISDKIKKESAHAISRLHSMGVSTTMLSGDKHEVVQSVAKEIGIKEAYGELLPVDKVDKTKQIKNPQNIVAFVGDGVNDAPVMALSDVGIAMGGLGSDMTIETADVVIQDDRPDKIPMAIAIGKQTKRIVWQNITMAFVVKAAVLIIGASGLATMWEAVFADVGVALLAILNAVRIQKMRF